jgi:hypothetical protein
LVREIWEATSVNYKPSDVNTGHLREKKGIGKCLQGLSVEYEGGVAVYVSFIHNTSRNRRIAMKNLGNQPPSCYSQKLCTPCFIDKIFDIVMTSVEFYSV